MIIKNFKTIQAILKVSRKAYITPHYIRIWLTGKDVDAFEEANIGEHNKILIPPEGLNEIHFPQFDVENQKWIHPPEEIRSTVRTYTHRGIDKKNKEIWIDFVAHGTEGPASAWAINAKEGDILGVMMKKSKKPLFPIKDYYLLIGDATAVPVLGAILEQLPVTAKGICIIEVQAKEDEHILKTKADIDYIWLYNIHLDQKSLLPGMVKKIKVPKDNRFAYVAAESAAVKEIRKFLCEKKNFQREEYDAYAYWKSGVSEDKSKEDRKFK